MNRRDFIGTTALLTTQFFNSVRPSFAEAGKGPQSSPSASLRFFGSPDAELFTRELDESFQGVLRKNFVPIAANGFPAGFVHASPPGQIWGGTMWTRDGGTFMRELVMRGHYEQAALLSDCLIRLVQKNEEGFYSFPTYFRGSQPRTGSELDGTASIIIGMVLLWQRLTPGHPEKKQVSEFLFQAASPVNYLKSRLATQPLVAGGGEFGGGMGTKGDWYNVVQNNLTVLALLAAANMAEESGSRGPAEDCRRLAAKLRDSMEKYLVDSDGCWIWCIDPRTLKPVPAVNDSEYNRGFGGINGVACMYSDALGLEPLASNWKGIGHCEKTLMRLHRTPLRAQQFERYGIWTQFDLLAAGLSTSAYGQGYALQTMLLFDKLDMAGKGLSWLVNATYRPLPEYTVHRESPYYFYERMYSPDAVGKLPLEEGCGALNLVNVTEPLKVSRLILGVDDTYLKSVSIIPRIPSGWKGVEARNWPIRTRQGVVTADIIFERKGTGGTLRFTSNSGAEIEKLRVRLPSANGNTWHEKRNVRTAHVSTI